MCQRALRKIRRNVRQREAGINRQAPDDENHGLGTMTNDERLTWSREQCNAQLCASRHARLLLTARGGVDSGSVPVS